MVSVSDWPQTSLTVGLIPFCVSNGRSFFSSSTPHHSPWWESSWKVRERTSLSGPEAPLGSVEPAGFPPVCFWRSIAKKKKGGGADCLQS